MCAGGTLIHNGIRVQLVQGVITLMVKHKYPPKIVKVLGGNIDNQEGPGKNTCLYGNMQFFQKFFLIYLHKLDYEIQTVC